MKGLSKCNLFFKNDAGRGGGGGYIVYKHSCEAKTVLCLETNVHQNDVTYKMY